MQEITQRCENKYLQDVKTRKGPQPVYCAAVRNARALEINRWGRFLASVFPFSRIRLNRSFSPRSIYLPTQNNPSPQADTARKNKITANPCPAGDSRSRKGATGSPT